MKLDILFLVLIYCIIVSRWTWTHICAVHIPLFGELQTDSEYVRKFRVVFDPRQFNIRDLVGDARIPKLGSTKKFGPTVVHAKEVQWKYRTDGIFDVSVIYGRPMPALDKSLDGSIVQRNP